VSDFNGTCILSTDFQTVQKYRIFMKIHSVEFELCNADEVRTDGRTDEDTAGQI